MGIELNQDVALRPVRDPLRRWYGCTRPVGVVSATSHLQSCDPDTYFQVMRLIVNTNLCRDWPGATWGSADICDPSIGYATCAEFIGNEPGLLDYAYWDINFIKVFQAPDAPSSSSPALKAR